MRRCRGERTRWRPGSPRAPGTARARPGPQSARTGRRRTPAAESGGGEPGAGRRSRRAVLPRRAPRGRAGHRPSAGSAGHRGSASTRRWTFRTRSRRGRPGQRPDPSSLPRAAIAAPRIPPPMTSRSNGSAWSRSRVAARPPSGGDSRGPGAVERTAGLRVEEVEAACGRPRARAPSRTRTAWRESTTAVKTALILGEELAARRPGRDRQRRERPRRSRGGASTVKITWYSSPRSSTTSGRTRSRGKPGGAVDAWSKHVGRMPRITSRSARTSGEDSGSASATSANRTEPPSMRASTRFMTGEPMNAATKRFAG